MKRRDTTNTYFEMLDWYFKRQRQVPISPAAQAVMSHILHECNANYGNSCSITTRILASDVNIDVRTLRAKIAELEQSSYVKYVTEGQDCYKIEVSCAEKGGEVCTDATKLQQNCKQDVGVARPNWPQRKEKKLIKFNKNDIRNYEKIFEEE